MKDWKIFQFLEQVSLGEPVPGGGSVSALAGALSASLLSMVANLTIGKSGYEEVKAEMEEIQKKAESLRKRLLDAVEDDSKGFEQVMVAYRLPKKTEAEREQRSRLIQEAYKNAIQTPMEVCQISLQLLALCTAIVEKGNIATISDAGVALYLADAALRGGVLNVRINLGPLTDETFKTATKKSVDEIEREGSILKEIIQDILFSKMAKHLR